MAHDVFISYSQKDKPTADAACAALEAAGIRCWIASRDVPFQTSWPAAIVGAIGQCRVMVLVFSSQAVASKDVQREVVQAFQNGVVVVPLRIEDVRPSGDMAYYMSNSHWLDALTPPLAAHLKTLCQTVQGILSTKTQDAAASSTSTNLGTSDVVRVPSSDAPPQPKPKVVAPEIHNSDAKPTALLRPALAPIIRDILSRLFTAIRGFHFGRSQVRAIVFVGVFTVLVGEAIVLLSQGSARRSEVYEILSLLIVFPSAGTIVSTFWIVHSRFRSFLFGMFMTFIFAAIPLVIDLGSRSDSHWGIWIALLLLVPALISIVGGLVRAFFMVPQPSAPHQILSTRK